MPYVKIFDRNQLMVYSWDELVEPDSDARIIDAFIDSLDLEELGFKGVSQEGRPRYREHGLLKLYVYGNRKGIRSSRKLAESCKTNIEVKWMLGGAEPDFRTVSDFRKDNVGILKKVFHEFNRRISGAVEWGFVSVDGSKFQANNGKDNNFTKNKLDDRIKWLDAHTDEYLRQIAEIDERDDEEEIKETDRLTKELLEEKLKEAQERLERYKGYQKLMEETGVSQLSVIDADAKLTKSKNGFIVGYNPQTAVDSNTHLIRDYEMTNQVTDHGLLCTTLKAIREEEAGIVEVVADKGYEKAEDMIECLEKGIIPHVITDDGKEGYELELSYNEAAEAEVSATEPEEIKRCLHAGIIPEVYKEVVTKIEVKEVRRLVREEEKGELEEKSVYGTEEEMLERAKEGYFVRDPERNLVYCPNGEILRQKSIKKNGCIRYSNKNACRHCKYRDKCYKGKNEWKEVDFTKDCLEKPCKEWLKAEGKKSERPEQKRKGHYEIVKVVKLFLKPSLEKISQRMCLSEHPFGTIKRAMGATYFLLEGMRKVDGEFALFCLGYNIKRARNLLGFGKMMELMVKA